MPSGPAFLFDLDGTLVDSVYQHVLAWREALESVGIELNSDERSFPGKSLMRFVSSADDRFAFEKQKANEGRRRSRGATGGASAPGAGATPSQPAPR